MFVIEKGNKIKIVQGDTGCIRLKINNYPLSEGDEVIFGLASKPQPQVIEQTNDLLIRKTVTDFDEEGCAHIFIEGEDTLDLEPGVYLYEIQVNTKDGRIDTVVNATKLTILEGIIHG